MQKTSSEEELRKYLDELEKQLKRAASPEEAEHLVSEIQRVAEVLEIRSSKW